MPTSNLTLRRRQLAVQLRKMRQEAGMTIEEVAGRLPASPTKISRMENGQRGASPRDIRDLSEIYGVDDERVVSKLIALASESRYQGLRQEFGDLGHAAMYTHMDIEAAAFGITELQISYLPGLLQVEEYARSLIRGTLPGLAMEMLERRVQARKKRQARLWEEPPLPYCVIVDEAALRREVGGSRIMRRQLDHLLWVAAEGRVTLQVMPFCRGAYTGMDGPFMLYELPEPMPTPIVFVETMDAVEYLEKPTTVALYRTAIDRLKSTALPPAASIALIDEIKGSFAGSRL
ncbi:helix-turn-helix domain-containing protein [Nonomuraea sp. PA05]|uniref:helix-turn-helix domain-containing protein n=1 Tax=Nonomuraea sp. PA05 TaxID=2604466 RepID=UPI0011D2FD9C|nr:helix-turn-helix transcriptional regulator [Nonomuraea sp. PA05]TYB61335.1 helix-turn-helix domain-containing protein [Nonomuraea sp. PA05]